MEQSKRYFIVGSGYRRAKKAICFMTRETELCPFIKFWCCWCFCLAQRVRSQSIVLWCLPSHLDPSNFPFFPVCVCFIRTIIFNYPNWIFTLSVYIFQLPFPAKAGSVGGGQWITGLHSLAPEFWQMLLVGGRCYLFCIIWKWVSHVEKSRGTNYDTYASSKVNFSG